MEWGNVERVLQAAAALGLGLGAAACGPAVDDVRDADTMGEGHGSSTSVGTTSGGSTISGDPSEGTTDAGPASASGPMRLDLGDDSPKFDLGPVSFDLGPVEDCGVQPHDPTCDEPLGANESNTIACLHPPEGVSCDEVTPESFLQQVPTDCVWCGISVERLSCEPFEREDGSCCSWVVLQVQARCPPAGRPFTVEGSARVPSVVERDDWSRPCAPRLQGLDASTRATLAQAWAREACFEAASVASFSRFVLQLMSLAAPPELLVQAQAAIADEVRHARALFGLASAYAGHSLGPGDLAVDHALENTSDPIDVAVSLASEGCIAETISAMQLAVAAERAEDPEVRALLAGIAEDELRHAELAWSALGWMLMRGDDTMRTAVADVFRRATEQVPDAVSIADHLPTPVLRAAGRLSADERLEIAQRALAHCVAPAAAVVFEPWTTFDRSLPTRA